MAEGKELQTPVLEGELLTPTPPIGLHWAVSGLKDTLLRCHIQPEYLNGHYPKEVQQGI